MDWETYWRQSPPQFTLAASAQEHIVNIRWQLLNVRQATQRPNSPGCSEGSSQSSLPNSLPDGSSSSSSSSSTDSSPSSLPDACLTIEHYRLYSRTHGELIVYQSTIKWAIRWTLGENFASGARFGELWCGVQRRSSHSTNDAATRE